MREGSNFNKKEFDVTDINAEMAAEKAKKEIAERQKAMIETKVKTTKNIHELSDAGMKLDEKKLAEARKKIAEGTGEVPLSDEDLEEVEELSNENLEETN